MITMIECADFIGLALRIPTQAGRGFRFDPGQGSDLMSATIPR